MPFSDQVKPNGHKQTQETLALLTILARGHRQLQDGKVRPAREVLDELRTRRRVD